MTRYIKRSMEAVLAKAASEFPAIVLTGPRQSGKTTLLKRLFGREYRYISLEPPDIRAAALEDPGGFLEIYAPPVILDEVQYAPNLLPYVKERIDARRNRTGQYLITGSQNLLRRGVLKHPCRGNLRKAMLPERLLLLTGRSGRNSCGGAIPSSSPIPAATSTCGMRATSKPTSSETYGRSGKWAIYPSFRASSDHWRREPLSFSA